MKLLYGAKIKTILILVFLLICAAPASAWCAKEHIKEADEKNVMQKLEKLDSSKQSNNEEAITEILARLDKLRFAEEQSKIYDKWDVYLKNITPIHFSNEEYLETIMKLGIDYAGSFKNLSECVRITEENEKQYSSVWLDDLRKKYDKEYIVKNQQSISLILMGISSARQSGACAAFEREAIYKESHYIYFLNRYVRYFLDYVDTLDKEEQEQISAKIQYAKSIREISIYPLKELLADGNIRNELLNTALNSRKHIDPELRDFLMKHPSFVKPFDIMKAVKDLRQYK